MNFGDLTDSDYAVPKARGDSSGPSHDHDRLQKICLEQMRMIREQAGVIGEMKWHVEKTLAQGRIGSFEEVEKHCYAAIAAAERIVAK